MEEMQFFLTAVSTVGFPIAACIVLFWLYNKLINNLVPLVTQLSENMKDMKETMKDTNETMAEVKISLNLFNQNFTDIFSRLAALEADKREVK